MATERTNANLELFIAKHIAMYWIKGDKIAISKRNYSEKFHYKEK